MFGSKILVQGKFYPSDIDVHFNLVSQRKVDLVLEQKMEVLWEGKFLEMKEKGVRIWNGKNYRLNRFSVKDGSLFLDLGIIEYKINSMMKFVPEFKNFSDEFLAKGFFVCGLIETSDHFFVFGNLSGVTPLSSEKGTDFIGGVATPDDVEIDSGEKLFEMMFKEMREEINVDEKFVLSSCVVGLVQTETYHVGSVFKILLSLTKDEVEKLFLERNDGEMKSLSLVPAAEVIAYVSGVQGYGKVVAEMLQ